MSARPLAAPTRPDAIALAEADAVLQALADSLLVIDREGAIRRVNAAAEQFFDTSAAGLHGRRLDELLPADSPLFSLIKQALAEQTVVSDYGVSLASPRIGEHFVTVQVAPLGDGSDSLVLSIREQSIARKIDHQLTHRSAARSMTAMAAMLAHEVKNPLSGIRGAAQLLEDGLAPADRELTRLICEETDRICRLVDDMEVFADGRPIERQAVNIHEVLDYVRRVAEHGFARRLRICESYDPSLPPVYGNREQLIQAFLNLVKNACEAVPEGSGDVTIATAYRHGVRLAVPGTGSRVHLPLLVAVRDTGEGIPDDLRPHLFDPFVTTKANGKGLGLALVAKIINDHGGVIEFDSMPRRTEFRVMLPMAPSGPPAVVAGADA